MGYKQYANELKSYNLVIRAFRLIHNGVVMGYRFKKTDGINITYMDVAIKTLDKFGYKIIEGQDIRDIQLIILNNGTYVTEDEIKNKKKIMEWGSVDNTDYIDTLCNNFKNSLSNRQSTYAYCTRWTVDKDSEGYKNTIIENNRLKAEREAKKQEDVLKGLKLDSVLALNKQLSKEQDDLKAKNKELAEKLNKKEANIRELASTKQKTTYDLNTSNTDDNVHIVKSQVKDYVTKKDMVSMFSKFKTMMNEEHIAFNTELKDMMATLFEYLVTTKEDLNSSIKEQDRFNNYFKKSIVDMGVELANINTTHSDVLSEVGTMVGRIETERKDNECLILQMSEVLHDQVELQTDELLKAINDRPIVSGVGVDTETITTIIEDKISESNKGKVAFKTGKERVKAPIEWWLAFKGLADNCNGNWKKGVSYILIYDDRYSEVTKKVIEDNKLKLDESKKGVLSFKTQTLTNWYADIDDIIANVEKTEE